MNFEEWEDKWLDDHLGKHPSPADAWDAATTEANRMLGDQSNEAEKDARRETALTELYALWDSDQLGSKHVRAIIQKAQG